MDGLCRIGTGNLFGKVSLGMAKQDQNVIQGFSTLHHKNYINTIRLHVVVLGQTQG
jgi:hypothetical protein